MKSTIKALGLCVTIAAGLSVSIPSFAATTLRIGTVLAPDDPMGQGLEKFKKEVEAATNGDVQVQVFHNSQLGDTTEMIDQARAGANVGTVTDVARIAREDITPDEGANGGDEPDTNDEPEAADDDTPPEA